MSSHHTTYTIAPDSRPVFLSALVGFFGCLFAGFGVLAVQYGISLHTGTDAWANQLIHGLLEMQLDPEPNLPTVEETLALYRASLGAMTTHMVVGGLVVALGLLQFVPRLRRNYRRVHRLLGGMMLLGMAAVSISAMVFLSRITMSQEIAGNAFYIGLWGLAVMSLLLLWQSLSALASKDFRAHMVWTALAFSCFLTAPMLRINYAWVGLSDPMTINRLVQNSVGSALALSMLVAGLWLVYVGDRDMPYRGQKDVWQLPRWAIRALIAGTVATLLLGTGFLLVGELDHLLVRKQDIAVLLAVWLASKVWLALESGRCWERGMQGQKPQGAFVAATVSGVALTLALASHIDRTTFQGHALYYGFVHYGVVEITVLLAACFTPALSTGRSLFTLGSAGNVWALALLPGMMTGAVRQGLQLDEAIYSALGRGVSLGLILSFSVGGIAVLRWLPARRGTRVTTDVSGVPSA